jgi:hypothetical protein
MPDHVVLVSIDGFRPEFALDERWPAPTLQQLAWEGAVAERVRCVFPTNTYPCHTTIVTGALPARHGIVHNRPFEPDGQSGRWYFEASHLQAPTLWDAVRAAGGTTASIAWPVTVGAEIDWNVPDVWPPDDSEEAVEVIRKHTTPKGLFEELEREATGRLCDENFAMHRLMREDRVGAIGAYLFARYRPTLLLVHLIGTDHIQHEYGRTNPKTRRAVGAADRAIGQILETVERLGMREQTAFVIVGDHGTVDVHTEVRPNVVLVEAGLREARHDRGDWKATFHASGGAAFLRVRGDDREAIVARVRESLDTMEPGVRRLFRIVERDELGRLGADPEAPFALAALPGVELSDEADGELVGVKRGGAHGYHPDEPEMMTGFVASGAGIRKGAVVPILPLENVAPIVASLLGLELETRDGVLFPGLLD